MGRTSQEHANSYWPWPRWLQELNCFCLCIHTFIPFQTAGASVKVLPNAMWHSGHLKKPWKSLKEMFTEVRSCRDVLLFAKEFHGKEFVILLVLHIRLHQWILEAVVCYPCMPHGCNVPTSLEGRKCSYSLSPFSVGNPAVAKHRGRSHGLQRAALSAVPLSTVLPGAAGNSEREPCRLPHHPPPAAVRKRSGQGRRVLDTAVQMGAVGRRVR